jgi:1,4-alpha-glucan branching enzyme
MIVYERAGLLFIFNFHPTNSFTDYRVGVDVAGDYKVVLSSDEKRYGGFENVTSGGKYPTTPMEWNGRKNQTQVKVLVWIDRLALTSKTLQVYIPARTCLVLAKC